jgi:chaperonin GroES
MNIRPLGDKVIVERLEAEAVTAGGIVLPDSARPSAARSSASATASYDDGTRRIQLKGDQVLFACFSARKSRSITNTTVLGESRSAVLDD